MVISFRSFDSYIMLSSTSLPTAYLKIKKTGLGSSSFDVYTDLIFKKSATTSISTYSITFPNKTGTLALTSDIVSKYNHNIMLYFTQASYMYSVYFNIVNTSSTAISSYQQLRAAVLSLQNTYITSPEMPSSTSYGILSTPNINRNTLFENAVPCIGMLCADGGKLFYQGYSVINAIAASNTSFGLYYLTADSNENICGVIVRSSSAENIKIIDKVTKI